MPGQSSGLEPSLAPARESSMIHNDENEVVVTDRGKPVIVLRTYDARAATKPGAVNYLKRLRSRMPIGISHAERLSLDEADRGER